MTDKVGSLEDEAIKRKERLKLLKRKLDSGTENENETPQEALPKPKFRSYRPQDESLKEAVLPDADVGDVTSEIKDQLDAADTKVVIEELDITNLAPRKPEWDLKRDVSKKLEKLERRTQKAIAELIWERLKEGQEDNMGAMVTLATVEEESKTSDK